MRTHAIQENARESGRKTGSPTPTPHTHPCGATQPTHANNTETTLMHGNYGGLAPAMSQSCRATLVPSSSNRRKWKSTPSVGRCASEKLLVIVLDAIHGPHTHTMPPQTRFQAERHSSGGAASIAARGLSRETPPGTGVGGCPSRNKNIYPLTGRERPQSVVRHARATHSGHQH